MWQVPIKFLLSNTDLNILAPSFAQLHSKWGKAEIVSEYGYFDLALLYFHDDNDLN